MKKTTTGSAFKLALIATALVASGAAFTVQAHGPDRGHGHAASADCPHMNSQHGKHAHSDFHRGNRDMHGQHMSGRVGMVVPGYGVVSRDFVDGMGLTQDQMKLIEDARSASKAMRDARVERFKAERIAGTERFNTAIQPEAALKQADERREQARAERRQIDDKWVAVWNSLDASQQERVAGHLKQRAENAQKRAEKMEERRKLRDANASDRT